MTLLGLMYSHTASRFPVQLLRFSFNSSISYVAPLKHCITYSLILQNVLCSVTVYCLLRVIKKS